jgi:hypothetical protein
VSTPVASTPEAPAAPASPSPKEKEPEKAGKAEKADEAAAPSALESVAAASAEVKVDTNVLKPTGNSTNSTRNSTSDQGMAILVTGATHARELLSSQVPLFLALKLLHQGVV